MPQAIQVVAAVASLAQQRRAIRSQERAAGAQMEIAREQQRQQELQAAVSRRRTIRAAQIERARTLASGQAMGAIGGSAIAGGMTSLSSQLGGALGYQTQMTDLSRNISGLSQQAGMFTMQANKALGQAELFGSLSKFAGQAEEYMASSGSTAA